MQMRRGDYRLGYSEEGTVVAFRPSIIDFTGSKRLLFNDKDVSTQWAAMICGNGLLVGVTLEIEWVGTGSKLLIPFDLDDDSRAAMREIAEKKKVFLVNIDSFEDGMKRRVSEDAIYADVSKNQVTEWLDMWERKEDIRTWKEID